MRRQGASVYAIAWVLTACADARGPADAGVMWPEIELLPSSELVGEVHDWQVISHISAELQQSVYYTAGSAVARVENTEFDGAVGPYTYSYRISVPYPIDGITARWGHEFYVHGQNHNAEEVIERWTVFPPKGAWNVTRPTLETAIGVSAPLGPDPTMFVVGGGGFIAPSDRDSLPRVARRVVLETGTLGRMTLLEVDPNGRFLFVVSQDGDLYQVPLPPPDSTYNPSGGFPISPLDPPILLASSSSYPALSGADTMQVEQHTLRGRLFGIFGSHSNSLLELVDADNDGLIDAFNEFIGTDYLWLHSMHVDPDIVPAFVYCIGCPH